MSSSESSSAASASFGDDLPPVQPPSAGFIIQLFVVPALIVLAVVAVWALFGRIAAGEQDWQQLVQELDSSNPHVYRRAMFGLAQLLDTDRRLGERGQELSSNPQIAEALSKRLHQQLLSRQVDDDTLSAQVYLARAHGLLDVPASSIPVLIEALDPQFDIEVRKGAVMSIAMIGGRALEREEPLEGNVATALVRLSQDANPSLKRAAAFALGLVPGPESEQRLTVLLNSSDDWMASVNAAIALSRRDSTAGYDVFVTALSTPPDPASAEARQDRVLILTNTLKAIGELASRFSPQQRAELKTLAAKLAADDAETRVRVDAQAALSALNAAG